MSRIPSDDHSYTFADDDDDDDDDADDDDDDDSDDDSDELTFRSRDQKALS